MLDKLQQKQAKQGHKKPSEYLKLYLDKKMVAAPKNVKPKEKKPPISK